MPRQPRLDIPDVLHHVIVRGIERRDIFADDADKERFLASLSALLTSNATTCYAWALMSNHLHLLLKPTRISLAETMRRLLTGYAVYFNRKYSRNGHLFQNRYKSILCEEEPYFLELVRYIHLNPLRAGMVSDLKELDCYQWSGHAVLLGNRTMGGQNTDEVLARFNTSLTRSVQGYRQFITDGITAGHRHELVGGGLKRSQADCLETGEVAAFDERILGSGGFVEMLTQGANTGERKRPHCTLADLLTRVCHVTGVAADRMACPGKERAVARAKAIFCFLAVREYGYTGTEAGKTVCIGTAGASIAVRRGGELLKNASEIRAKLIEAEIS
jgi:REP element-mobilizing transposase RayT